MLSGNGRHRRPRQAPALLVAAGVTGSALAIPLLAAASANAADNTTWDKVAGCETGAAWSADTGNGHYGGLQLTQKQWEANGGLDYASSPDQASRSQQIAVAEKVLEDEGADSWGTCGVLYDLGKNDGSAQIDTGVAGDGSSSSDSDSTSSDASGSSDSSASPDYSNSLGLEDSSSGTASSSDTATSDPSASPSASASADAKDKSAKSGSSDSSTDVSSPAATSSASDNSDNSWQTGGSSALVDTGSLGSGKHRGGSADEDSAADTASASGGKHAAKGDTDSKESADDADAALTADSLAAIVDSLDSLG
ncbi:transglycosylase family protein [Streptomyces mangrovisoli]|uniref:transglycosylase family protein n=1 Tax=Streptomyces mangrovisoli TaxID=1428628 RepID=UPI000A451A55